MSSVRKYMLVPEEEMIRKLQLLNYPAAAKAAIQAESNMQQALSDNSIPLDLKSKQYLEMLNKFMTLKDVQPVNQQTLPIYPHEAPTVDSELSTIAESNKDSALNISGFLPSNLRKKGNQLIEFMKQHAPNIKWNNRGQLINNGEIIPRSNIVDLVRGAIQKKNSIASTSTNIPGWSQFQKDLSEANVPITIAPRIHESDIFSFKSTEPSGEEISPIVYSTKRRRLQDTTPPSGPAPSIHLRTKRKATKPKRLETPSMFTMFKGP